MTGLEVVDLSPPAQVIASFEDVVSARQFAKTLAENSRQYHGAILQRAQGYSADLIATARGEAGAFTALLENYQRQPELVARRLLRESLDAVMGQIYSRSLVPAGRTAPSILIEPSPEYSR